MGEELPIYIRNHKISKSFNLQLSKGTDFDGHINVHANLIKLQLEYFLISGLKVYRQYQNHSYNYLSLIMGEELSFDLRNHKISKAEVLQLSKGTDIAKIFC